MGIDEVLKKAHELDEMERSVTSSEADVLERVLEAYADGKKPKIKDSEKIEAMYHKYLGPRDENDGESAESGEADAEDPADEDFDL